MRKPNSPQTPKPLSSNRRQKVNTWLLAITAIVLFVFGPGIYFWHYYQNRAMAGSLIKRAVELEERKDYHAAAEYIERYLQINPQDAEQREHLANVYDSFAADFLSKSRASQLYSQAIGWADGKRIPALRARLGELLLETRELASAENEANTLLDELKILSQNDPNDQDCQNLEKRALRLRALAVYEQCKEGNSKANVDVGQIIKDASAANSHDQDLIRILVEIYRKEPQWIPRKEQTTAADNPDRIMSDWVEKNKENPEAWLTQYLYKRQYDLPGAEKDLQQALTFCENDPHPRVLFVKAESEFDAAREIARKTDSTEADLLNLKDLLASAAKYYRATIDSTEEKSDETRSDKQSSNQSKSKAAPQEKGQSKDSWAELREMAFEQLGYVLQQQQKPLEALDTWKAGLQKNPRSLRLNLILASTLLDLNRPDEAARADKSKGTEGPIETIEKVVSEIDLRSSKLSDSYREFAKEWRQRANSLRSTWYYLKNDFKNALPILKDVASEEPKTPQQAKEISRANYYLGIIHSGKDFRDPDLAQQYFENSVPKDILPKDPKESRIRKTIIVAKLLAKNGLGEKAREYLQVAIKAAPDDIIMPCLLAELDLRGKNTEDARKYLRELEENENIDKRVRASVLAFGYDFVKDPEKAEKALDEVVAFAKDSIQGQLALAGQLMTRYPGKAEEIVRNLLKADPSSMAARRLLAQLLISRGGEPEWKEALSLLDEKNADPQEKRLYQSLQALLYFSRGGKENLQKARVIFENLIADSQKPHPEEIFYLAQIYDAEGNQEGAETQFDKLIKLPEATVAHAVAYVGFLLKKTLPKNQEDLRRYEEKVGEAIDRLKELAPESLPLLAAEANRLKKFDRSANVSALIESWAEKQRTIIPGNPQTEAQFDSTIGALYSSLEMHADAERWYRKAMEYSPDGYRRLASALGRQGRYHEAIVLCEKAAEKDPSVVPPLVLASVLLEGQPAENDYERAEALLKKAVDAYPDQTDLLGALGALHIQRSNLDEATALFRRVLELRPRDELAMNNLATALIERPDTLSEGKELIEQALERFGPQPGLLDVKGVCLIVEGKSKDAISLFEDACSSPRADPRYCFHWAVACQRAGDKERAKIMLKRSLEMNLYGQILTPSDRKMLAELEREFTDKG